MKYCAKCGNPMEDDMIFCQKCGTKFEGVVSTAPSDIETKLAKMKKYNLVIDAQTISWEYLREDGERAGNITVKQDKLCQELSDLIKDILETVSDDDRDLVEREVYTYVLEMGYKMCKEGEKLFANYSGFKELFDMGNNLVRTGQLDAGTFLNQMMQQDYVYKVISGLQGLHSSRLKETLDENVIYNNMEYQGLTKQLVQAFNDMWVKCIKRYTDFFLSPGEDYINQNWEIYNVLLKGLPSSAVDMLDEHGWQLALDDWEKNHNGWQYKQDFIKKRDQQRDARRKREQEIEDKKYWESHPEEYAETQKKQEDIVGIREKIREILQKKVSVETEKHPFDNKRDDIQREIDEKQNRIEKLGKKIFGKKKAEEEIEKMKSQIEKLKNELQEVNEKLQVYQKLISNKETEIKALEREIRNIEQEIAQLRNR